LIVVAKKSNAQMTQRYLPITLETVAGEDAEAAGSTGAFCMAYLLPAQLQRHKQIALHFTMKLGQRSFYRASQPPSTAIV
jgi:hypothetical protein